MNTLVTGFVIGAGAGLLLHFLKKGSFSFRAKALGPVGHGPPDPRVGQSGYKGTKGFYTVKGHHHCAAGSGGCVQTSNYGHGHGKSEYGGSHHEGGHHPAHHGSSPHNTGHHFADDGFGDNFGDVFGDDSFGDF